MSVYRIQLCFLWGLIVIGMMLHFDYHVSGIFYGVDVRLPSATGEVPQSAAFIRFVFQLAPMMFISFLLFFEQKWLRTAHLGIGILFTLAHTSHLISEFKKPDLSQINLLALVLVISVLINIVSYRWWRASAEQSSVQSAVSPTLSIQE
jgi:hypothetical protein